MNNKMCLILVMCSLALAACSNQYNSYTNEVKSKSIEARAGQEFSQYALYSPELTATVDIEYEDVNYAIGTFNLIEPTLDKLKSLAGNNSVSLYYNQIGQVIIDIKGK